MKQQRFAFDGQKKTVSKLRDQYDTANLRSAKLILEAPDQFGGLQSGLCQWAKAAIERIEGVRADTTG